jgi:hypothetical protein
MTRLNKSFKMPRNRSLLETLQRRQSTRNYFLRQMATQKLPADVARYLLSMYLPGIRRRRFSGIAARVRDNRIRDRLFRRDKIARQNAIFRQIRRQRNRRDVRERRRRQRSHLNTIWSRGRWTGM